MARQYSMALESIVRRAFLADPVRTENDLLQLVRDFPGSATDYSAILCGVKTEHISGRLRELVEAVEPPGVLELDL